MAEKQEGSGREPEGSPPVEILGTWPNINLELIDHTGTVDYGYDPTAPDRKDDSASAGDPVEGKSTGIFRFHTELTLDGNTLERIRVELRKGTKQGRQAAYRILKDTSEFEIGGSAGKKMVKAALQAPWWV